MHNFKTRGCAGAALAAFALFLSGCATKAPTYQPSLDNIQVLKKTSAPVALGLFSVSAGTTGAQSISLRGSSMGSPIGSDYAAYLADALRQELVMAGKLDAQSKLEISGMLLKNDIDASGFSTASGEIEARFIVKSAGRPRYDKTKRTTLSWESSFMGAVAIPKAIKQYPVIVQSLLAQLLADPDFQTAVK